MSISSAPISELMAAITPTPLSLLHARQLKYRDFLTVVLIGRSDIDLPDNWVYIHDPSVKVGRVQNFRSWSPEMIPDGVSTCLGLEYFCFEGDGLWNASDDELVALAKREIAQIGLMRAEDVVDASVVRQQKAYPVYDDSYARNVETIRFEVATRYPGLHLVGRNGMHKYNNQDHAMMTGLLTALNIVEGPPRPRRLGRQRGCRIRGGRRLRRPRGARVRAPRPNESGVTATAVIPKSERRNETWRSRDHATRTWPRLHRLVASLLMTTATRVDTRITHKPHSSSLDRARLRGFAVDAVRYFGVSLVALAVDWGGLALAHHTFGLNYLAAATVSFAAGLMVAWSLSAAFVFPGRRKAVPAAGVHRFSADRHRGTSAHADRTGASGRRRRPVARTRQGAGGRTRLRFQLREPPRVSVRTGGAVAMTFTPATADTSGRTGVQTAWLASLSAITFALTVFLLTHSAPGITGDAKIYIGRALADLDPAGVGRDMMFVLDGQSTFSVFTPLARALVAKLTPQHAALLLTAGSQVLWFAALVCVARVLAGSRAVSIVGLACLLPAGYGLFVFRRAAGDAATLRRSVRAVCGRCMADRATSGCGRIPSCGSGLPSDHGTCRCRRRVAARSARVVRMARHRSLAERLSSCLRRWSNGRLPTGCSCSPTRTGLR